MRSQDADAVDAVVSAAFASSFSRWFEIQRLSRLQPGGWFVAEEDGEPAGAVYAICYRPFAYVGLMSVRPEMQRLGIGLALLQRLLTFVAEQGCSTTLLDATEAGHPLYLRLGFVEESRTIQFGRDTIPAPDRGALLPAGIEHHHVANGKTMAAVSAFDGPLFGAPRAAVIESFMTDVPGRSLLSRDAAGSIDGYLVARSNYIGPWVATNPPAAERLLQGALRFAYPSGLLLNVPSENTNAAALLLRYGFRQTRDLPHMRHGPRVTRRRDLQYAEAGFATG